MSRESLFDVLSIVLSAAFVAGALMLILNGDGNGLRASTLTVEDVYAQVEQRLLESPGVLHVTYQNKATGPSAVNGTGQQWLDVVGEQAREQIDNENQASLHRLVTTSGAYQQVGDEPATAGPAEFWSCYGVGVATSVLLGCPPAGTQTASSVEEGRHRGRPVTAVIETGSVSEPGRTLLYTRRLYLETGTLMPFEVQVEGTWTFADASTQPHTLLTTFSYETLAEGALAADFFLPVSMGVNESDPEAAIRSATDLPVHWLGSAWEMPGVGTFALVTTEALPERGQPHRYSLVYGRADAPDQPPFLKLNIYFRDQWDANPGDPNEASFIGDIVVLFTEEQAPGATERLLTPAIYDALKASLTPYGNIAPPPASPTPSPSPSATPEPTETAAPEATSTPPPVVIDEPTATPEPEPEPTQPPAPTATRTPVTPEPGATPTMTPTPDPRDWDPDPTSTPVRPSPTIPSQPPTFTPPATSTSVPPATSTSAPAAPTTEASPEADPPADP